MNIDDLTIGEAKKLAEMFSSSSSDSKSLNSMVGKKVIIRTYSAGVWFGVLAEKSGNEVILQNARRMYRWHTVKSISLSSVAKYGVNYSKSKIIEEIDSVWLESIEIIPCSDKAIESLEEAPNVNAE